MAVTTVVTQFISTQSLSVHSDLTQKGCLCMTLTGVIPVIHSKRWLRVVCTCSPQDSQDAQHVQIYKHDWHSHPPET